MKYTNFDEFKFRQSVEKALVKVQAILGSEKQVRLPQDEEVTRHTYEDKYGLAEFVTNTSVAAQLTILENLGLTPEMLQTAVKWVHEDKSAVTLHFAAQDGCSFLQEKEVEIVSTEVQSESTLQQQQQTSASSTQSSFFGPAASSVAWAETKKTRVIQKVKEYHWKVYCSHQLLLFRGNDITKALELQSRNASTVLVTSGGQATARKQPAGNNNKPIAPIAEKTVHPSTEVQLTWLFQQLQLLNPSSFPGDKQEKDAADTDAAANPSAATTATSQFAIERTANSCKTPRRNDDIRLAYEFHQSLVHFMLVVLNFCLDRLEKQILSQHQPVATQAGTTVRLAVGTTCQMVGLEKDPVFNNKLVVVKEYIPSADRYRVEPVRPEDNLPPSLTIKKTNLRVTTETPMLSRVTVEDVFVPILPFMEKGAGDTYGSLSLLNPNQLLQAQSQSIQRAIETQISRVFPPRQLAKLTSQAEATMLLLCTHWLDLIEHYQNAVNYLEDLLRRQMLQAIGREVHTSDFAAFCRHHFSPKRGFYRPEYAPRPFCHAVRRDARHYPEGVVSIELVSPDATDLSRQPSRDTSNNIETWIRRVSGESSPSIFIPINAATSVEITGDRYLHGWIQHRFDQGNNNSVDGGSTNESPAYQLVARARQFSTFIVMLGTMAGSDEFDCQAAIVVQNKDSVVIPILTKVLPTAQEFQNAIASLSPQQQAFCRAFRAMQLESSVFGICIVQIKPQLELLLQLEAGALVKEIQLTQDLISLFCDYQIPSDLVSFGDEDEAMSGPASPSDRLAAVKTHVKGVLDVINSEKEKQLAEEERKADMRGEMGILEEEDDEESLEEDSEDYVAGDGTSLSSSMVAQASTATRATQKVGNNTTKKKRSKKVSARRQLVATSPKLANDSSNNAPGPLIPPASTLSQALQSSAASSDPSVQLLSPSSRDQDFTLIPKVLDAKFSQFDTDNSLRTTILTHDSTWTRSRPSNLLVQARSATLDEDDILTETNKALDLLDAISRSGTLPIACAELHVVVAVSHCFENDVMGTVIQENVDPIEKAEMASLVLASTIHGTSPQKLLVEDSAHAQRLTASRAFLVSE